MQDHMGSMLETEFPDHKIHFLYDTANMKAYQDKYKQSAQIIKTLLMELLKSNNSDKIYVRLHGYKSWLVIRIALEEKPEEQMADKMWEKCKEFNPEILFDVSKNSCGFVIKISI